MDLVQDPEIEGFSIEEGLHLHMGHPRGGHTRGRHGQELFASYPSLNMTMFLKIKFITDTFM